MYAYVAYPAATDRLRRVASRKRKSGIYGSAICVGAMNPEKSTNADGIRITMRTTIGKALVGPLSK
jgi:hypothetical protein